MTGLTDVVFIDPLYTTLVLIKVAEANSYQFLVNV